MCGGFIRFAFLILKLALIVYVIHRAITQAYANPYTGTLEEGLDPITLSFEECTCDNIKTMADDNTFYNTKPYQNDFDEFSLDFKFRGNLPTDKGRIILYTEKSLDKKLYTIEIGLFKLSDVEIVDLKNGLVAFSNNDTLGCQPTKGSWRHFILKYNWIFGTIKVIESIYNNTGTILIDWTDQYHNKGSGVKFFSFESKLLDPNYQVAFNCTKIEKEFDSEIQRLEKMRKLNTIFNCNEDGPTNSTGFDCHPPKVNITCPKTEKENGITGWGIYAIVVTIFAVILVCVLLVFCIELLKVRLYLNSVRV